MHVHQYHFLHFLKNKELDELYISMAIRSFALSMIGIFVPIYLIKLGYSFAHVLTFFAVLYFSMAVFVIPAAKISAKTGFKHSILLCTPLVILFYMMLYTIKVYNWPLYLLSIIYGVYLSMFWVSYHIDFLMSSDESNRGKEVGILKSLIFAFNVLGPFAGGFIISYLGFGGFNTIFITVSILLLGSTFPLFLSKDSHESFNFSMKRLLSRGSMGKQKLRDSLSFFGFGMETANNGIIWPIFIFFLILNNFTSLGFVASLSLFFSLVFSFIIGVFSDVKRGFVLKLGAIASALAWIFRSAVTSGLQIYATDSFYGTTKTTMSVPFEAMSYDKAQKSDALKYIVFREISINIGRVVLLLIMASLSAYTASFFLAVIGLLLMTLF